MLMSGLDIYFLEVSAHALLKAATKSSFRGKKSENLALGYFFLKRKRRSMTKLNYVFFFHNFGTFLPCSNTYFLEVSARVFCT